MNVAIIGAGPAGLTAACELTRRGVGVEVFESSPHVGGLARTMWAMVLDRRWRPRVRPSLHLTQLSPDPLSPAIIEHKPMRVVSAVREPAASQRAA